METMLQELEVWYVIPAVRRAFAIEMHKSGMKSVDIASRLGLTKSAISQYLHNSRAVEFKFNNNVKNEIKKSVQRIVNGESYIVEIQRMIRLLRDNKIICNFHHSIEKIEKNCDICFRK